MYKKQKVLFSSFPDRLSFYVINLSKIMSQLNMEECAAHHKNKSQRQYAALMSLIMTEFPTLLALCQIKLV